MNKTAAANKPITKRVLLDTLRQFWAAVSPTFATTEEISPYPSAS